MAVRVLESFTDQERTMCIKYELQITKLCNQLRTDTYAETGPGCTPLRSTRSYVHQLSQDYLGLWDPGEGLERSDVVSSLSCVRVLYDLKNAQQLARARRSAVSFS